MHVSVYVISPWSRDAEGSVPQLVLDAIANGWQTTIEDVTDQPGLEIRLGHSVLLNVICAPETLDSIRKVGRYTLLEKTGELAADERESLVSHIEEIQLLPARATREMTKQLLVERFREQGARDILKDAARDAFRQLAGENATDQGESRIG